MPPSPPLVHDYDTDAQKCRRIKATNKVGGRSLASPSRSLSRRLQWGDRPCSDQFKSLCEIYGECPVWARAAVGGGDNGPGPSMRARHFAATAVCQMTVCLNGGTCTQNPSDVTQYTCACPSGYGGNNCENCAFPGSSPPPKKLTGAAAPTECRPGGSGGHRMQRAADLGWQQLRARRQRGALVVLRVRRHVAQVGCA